ncbi:T9SS type B sorting domain-containing protein [Maribacter sp. PR1]|uniref:T9SS type B sorting domain-containing protein n=1 Tax=Maribacter cobaltidurans TaxID=1178778 RepID=A0ABU7IYW7_9FLAO|nr:MULTISPECIES: T9SS type B sorting domain-containing protein [Maribacter]MDC6390311.1 T9SS type B sorting domain-containing protein [Maribacter sp. PR1]MEE1977701.1 T9SS type B sorting domain-containing protein [Maribacter cobaltidurans]
MKVKSTFLPFALWHFFLTQINAQECPTLISPLDGDTDVAVDNLIQWTAVDGIIGYLVSLGTTPGGGEIINRRSSGLNNFYQPEVGLPSNTVVYVTISLFLPDAPIKVCPLKIFTTEAVTSPPACTRLASPFNNETEVRVNTNLEWEYAPGATDYRISIGTSPGNYDVVENELTGNTIFYGLSDNLELDQDYFVLIVPLNENGDASGCIEESFTTGVPTVSCLESDFPIITVPDRVALCNEDSFGIIQSNNPAKGYRWIFINPDGTENILSEDAELRYDKVGQYRLELYNTLNEFGGTIECPVSKNFQVVYSNSPIIEDVIISRENNGLRINVMVEEPGNYEYALDSPNSVFQESPIFTDVAPGERIVYVKDKYGCGITERLIEKELSRQDFPAFFTPNGDGYNDYWQYKKSEDTGEIAIEVIQIFDRYGSFLGQIDPKSLGWNGVFNGRLLPASDYWFRAISFNNKEIKGHFTLKR